MILRADVALGGTRLVATDFRSSGVIPFVFRRSYDSTNRTEGAFGQGWKHGFEMYLEISSEQIVCHGGPFNGEMFAPVALGKEGQQEESGFVLQHQTDAYVLFASPDRQFVFMKSGARGNIIPLAAIRNQAGQALRLEYSGRDLSVITNPEGQRLRLGYSGGRIQSLSIAGTAGERPVASFTYTLGGELASVTNADGATTRFGYNGGALVEVVHPTGARQWAQYDEEFRCLTLWDDSGRAFYLAHDPLRYLTRVVNAAGEQTIYQHVLGKQLIGEKTHLAYERNFYYDAVSRSIGQGREDGLTERFEQFDPEERRMTVLNNEMRVAFLNYDEANLLTSIEDAEEYRYEFSRNESGHPVRVTTPTQHTWSFDRDRLGRVQTVRTPSGRALKILWGATSREISDQLGLICKDSLDPQGNIVQRTDALGRTIRFDYSPAGVLRKVDVAGRYGIDFLYDEYGRLTGSIDTERNRYQIRRNAHGVVQGIETGRGNVELAIDKTGRLLQLGAAGQAFAIEYNEMNRPTAILSEAGTGKTIKYTSDGRVETGLHGERSFNHLNELTSSPEDTFSYGVTGEILVWENQSEEGERFIVFDYDASGLPVHIEGGWYDDSVELNLGYTPDGLLETLSRSDERVVTCERDTRGRLKVIHIADEVLEISYDPADRLVQIGELMLEYDVLDRPTITASQPVSANGSVIIERLIEHEGVQVECVIFRAGVVLAAIVDGVPIPLYWRGDMRSERIPASLVTVLAIVKGINGLLVGPLSGAQAALDVWTGHSRWSTNTAAFPTGRDLGCDLDFLDSFFLDPAFDNAHSERIPGQVSMYPGEDDLSVITGPHCPEARFPQLWNERSAGKWFGSTGNNFVAEAEVIRSLQALEATQ